MKTIPSITDRFSRRAFARMRVALLTIGVAALACQGLQAQQPLPFYEPFPAFYTNGGGPIEINGILAPGTRLNDAPANEVWAEGGGSGNGSPTNHIGAKMTYPGLWETSESNLGIFFSHFATGTRNRGFNFAATTSGTVYASFLLNVLVAPTNNRAIVTLTSSLGQSASDGVVGVFVNQDRQLLVSKNSSATPGSGTTSAVEIGTTNLVVARYTWSETEDEVALWLNPDSSTFNVNEGSVPAPTISTTTGADFSELSHFFVLQRNNLSIQSMVWLMDELRIANTWALVTPTNAPCVTADIFSNPTDFSTVADTTAAFTTIPLGSNPTFQWQVSTDGGNTWNNVSTGSGGDAATYTTPILTTTEDGNRFRTIVTVPCDGSSVTSSPAILTVTAANYTPLGTVMNDTFDDGDRGNIPITANNSAWVASDSASLNMQSGVLTGTPGAGTSRTWLGYFTTIEADEPVHLDVGRAIRVTLPFQASNIVSNGGNSIRLGLYDYADGGTRPQIDEAAVANSGENVRGYLLNLNFGTNFSNDNPITLWTRTATTSPNLLGTLGTYASLGAGPTDVALNGAPAFQSGVTYTLEFTVARTGFARRDVTVSITGGGTNWSFTAVDTDNTAFPRFDVIGIRPNNQETTADSFDFQNLMVEVISATIAPPDEIPVDIARSGNNVVLSWDDANFTLQGAPMVTGTYTNVPGASSPYTNSITGSQGYFRLINE